MPGLLWLLGLLILLVCLSLAIAIYNWYQLHHIRKHLLKSIMGVDAKTHKAFQLLANDMQKHLKYLEGVRTQREWTESEKEFVETFTDNLRDAEKFLSKQIKSLK